MQKWRVQIIAINYKKDMDTTESDWVEIELPEGYQPMCVYAFEKVKK